LQKNGAEGFSLYPAGSVRKVEDVAISDDNPAKNVATYLLQLSEASLDVINHEITKSKTLQSSATKANSASALVTASRGVGAATS